MRTASGTEAGLKGVALHVTAAATGASKREAPLTRRASTYMLGLKQAARGNDDLERGDAVMNTYPTRSGGRAGQSRLATIRVLVSEHDVGPHMRRRPTWTSCIWRSFGVGCVWEEHADPQSDALQCDQATCCNERKNDKSHCRHIEKRKRDRQSEKECCENMSLRKPAYADSPVRIQHQSSRQLHSV